MRTTPLKPSDVNDEIWRLLQRANEVVKEIYKAGDEYATSKGLYEDEHAQAILRITEGTVQEKKARADSQCKTAYMRWLKAEVKYKYLKSVLDITKEQLNACQSIGANLREEWQIEQRHRT